MANIPVLTNMDFTGNQILNAITQNLAAEPGTATKGLTYFNTTTNKLGCGNGTSFDYLGGIAVSNLDDVPDSSTRLAFLVAERAKLTGIATGATANATDAALRDRSLHTGSQSHTTISDFDASTNTLIAAGITGKANTASPTFTGTVSGITAAMVGLSNVDNTTDALKPVSTATTTALGLKANIASPTFTGVVGGITASMVGLSNVDNTTDLAKPVSTATNTALGLKANSASPAFTGTPTGLTKIHVGLANVDNTSDASKPISTATSTALGNKADLVGGLVPTSQLPSISMGTAIPVASQAAMLALTAIQVQPGDLAIRSDGAGTFMLMAADPSVLGNWTLLNSPTDAVTSVNGDTGTVVLAKADIGLSNVDNTTDAAKPVSTATTTALGLKANIASPTFTGTVGGITAAMVGLGSVNNTADASKPVSTAQQSALDLKAPLASPTFTGTPTGITKTHVGLSNVDNTSDVNKPVSTAATTANALDMKKASNLSDVANVVTARTNIGAVGKYAVDIGGATSSAVTHNLNTLDVSVSLFEKATGAEAITDIVHTSVNVVTVNFAVAPGAATYRVVVVG